MATPPLRTEVSDTYPNPSNAVARTGFGKLYDYVTGLLGSTGNAVEARAALGAVGLSGNETISGDKTFSGKLTLNNYKESLDTVADSPASYVIDCTGLTVRKITLTRASTFSFSNVPATGAVSLTLALVQDATGSRIITWPASVKWSGGSVPTLTTTAYKTDFISLLTLDGGVTWFGFPSGLNY